MHMVSLRIFFQKLDQRSEDRPPIAVTIALLVLGLYLVIRSLVLSPELSYGLIILTPDVQAARIVDSLRSDGVDVSDRSVIQDVERLVEAIRTVRTCLPNLVDSMDAVLARCRPRGHKMEIYESVAQDVGFSAASLRRRQAEFHSSATPASAAPGFFETLRNEAVRKFKDKRTDNSQI